jgi:hypothetical protein
VRHFLILLLALGLVAGCGGGDDDQGADSGTDVDQLLKDTFSGSKDVKSGKLDVKLDASAGGQNFAVKISGPFETTGTGKLPKLDIDASLEGGGQNLQGGITSTGDRGFVSYAGTDYEIAAPVFQQLKAGYEEQAKKSGSENNQSLATLGIDPRKWLTNAKNEGDAKVGDTDTIKITGDVDVPKLLDDVNTALGKLRSLGGTGAANLPQQLSEQDKKQATDAIKDLSVEIYTGKDDKILRRLLVAMKLEVPSNGSTQSADVKFDVQLLDVNESQDISAPSNPKPFAQLADKLDSLGLGGLGALGGGSSGSSGSGSGSGTSQKNLEKYSQCVQEANGDNSKIAKCADLLTP